MANTVTLFGRLVADANLRYLESGTSVARFTLAVDKQLSKEKRQEMEAKGQPTADFINCVAWDKLGETIAKYSGKGLRLLVNGRIQTGSYEKDGERRYTTDVVVNSLQIIDWKNSSTNSNNTETYDDFEDGFDVTEDDRIPF